MAARLKLDVDSMMEDFFSNTVLIGIVSSQPGYRFCWLLNQKFDFDFIRDTDLDINLSSPENKENYFPVFTYSVPLNGSRHIIYKLKNEIQFLLPEVKQLDYLWLIESQIAETEAMEIIAQLKEIPEIQLAQPLPVEMLKNTANLIL